MALTRCLIELALKRGVRVFTGVVLPENARMLNLLRDLELPERLRLESGVEYVEIDLLFHELRADSAGGQGKIQRRFRRHEQA